MEYKTMVHISFWLFINLLIVRITADEERYFLHAKSGAKLQSYIWRPKQGEPVKALVFISHGYAELMTPYYNQLAIDGSKAGLVMFGHDHVGHGRSNGKRAQAGNIQDYVDPVIQHCREVKFKYPDAPLFIIGHSMGGLIALLTILQTQVSNFFNYSS